jgi:hypothetical protein
MCVVKLLYLTNWHLFYENHALFTILVSRSNILWTVAYFSFHTTAKTILYEKNHFYTNRFSKPCDAFLH